MEITSDFDARTKPTNKNKKCFSPVSFMDGLAKKQNDLKQDWMGRTQFRHNSNCMGIGNLSPDLSKHFPNAGRRSDMRGHKPIKSVD